MEPLWVLTGSVTGAVVSTGGSVVTNTGMMVVSGATVVAGRVGGSVGAGEVGRMIGRGTTTGGVGTVGPDFVGQGPLNF